MGVGCESWKYGMCYRFIIGLPCIVCTSYQITLRFMPQQTDPAVPTKLSSVAKLLDGRKVRIAGRSVFACDVSVARTKWLSRMLSYDALTGIMLLSDQDQALLVDVSLCVEKETCWARESKVVVMVVGYVEKLEVHYSDSLCYLFHHVFQTTLPIPVLPAYYPAPVIDPSVVLRGLLVSEAANLDLSLWNMAIEERSGFDG
jgi:hypothetical protein